MAIFEPLRRGAEEFIDTLGEGWEWLRDRSASALTRFRRTPQEQNSSLPDITRGDSWGLLASDVVETGDELIVRVEVPGLEEQDLTISVVNDQLVVQGQKRLERERRQAHYHLLEAAYGAFERRVGLPCSVDADHAEAKYRNGVLTVRLPRSEKHRARRIRVKGA